MSLLDTNNEADFDRYMEKRFEFESNFKSRVVSVLIIDPKNEFSLKDLSINGVSAKYFNLSSDDYAGIGQWFNNHIDNGKYAYDGVLFDNINDIPDNAYKVDFEQLIISALKREDDLQMLPFGETIPFDEMMVAVKCKEYPEYLKGNGLYPYIIDMADIGYEEVPEKIRLKITYCERNPPCINIDAFDGNILSSNIGKKVATFEFDSLTRIGSNAITSNVNNVYVPPTVKRIEADAFCSFSKLIAPCIPEDSLEIKDEVLIACFCRDCDEVIVVPDGVTVIGRNAFKNSLCKKVILPKTVKKLEPYSLSCRSLTSVKLNKGLEVMEEGCLKSTSLKTLTIPDTVTTIGNYAFANCVELRKITIGNGVAHIGKGIIACNWLKEIKGKFASDDNLAMIRNGHLLAYANNAKVESYAIPEGVTHIERHAFYGTYLTDKLYELHIPDSVCEIEPAAFARSSIKKFTGKFTTPDNRCVVVGNRLIAYHHYIKCGAGPDGTFKVPKSVTEICEGACENCGRLSGVEWDDGIVKIGKDAFKNNSFLWLRLGPRLPSSLKEIGENAFSAKLFGSRYNYFKDGVIIPPTVQYIGYLGIPAEIYWFSSETPPEWEYSEEICVKTIYVPEHLIETYKRAYPQYADKIKAN
ncbi:MAG: leucine-rich repeat domain-containing protein [Bacteroidales bacterium]|nr:leucine-rich repeat domain-containing protein [Bacteroidales bacterium]